MKAWERGYLYEINPRFETIKTHADGCIDCASYVTCVNNIQYNIVSYSPTSSYTKVQDGVSI